jgi:hypothetical protein
LSALPDKCIQPDSLIAGNALSFEHQPHFAALIESMRAAQRPLLVIVGAGISMAAGLPSWPELVDRLESVLVPEQLKAPFRQLNSDDLTRRTDTLLHLTGETGLSPKNHQHLKDALYRDNLPRQATTPALSIAQLALVYPQPVSIITTNFDEVIDNAIHDVLGACESFSFDTWDDWIKLEEGGHRRSVMHLHGLEYPDDRLPLRPLVLSETDFRTYGRSIQERLTEFVDGRDVLILGASLADQNVVTPLARARHTPGTRFVVSTPRLAHPDLTPEDCAKVAVWQAEALHQAVGVRPVLLKSHSQVAQVITECVLSAHIPKQYARTVKGFSRRSSLHYGTRLRTAVEGAYEGLGASKTDGGMKHWDAIALSQYLNELTFAKDGPDARLRDLRKRHRGECAAEENIGLFVWLRDLPRRPGSSYALRLMVSSAYAHWRSWSSFRLEPIVASSTNAAVLAAYTGSAVLKDVPRTAHTASWQGAWAQPIVAAGTVSAEDVGDLPIDRVQIGALSVNTDMRVTSANKRDLSALAVLDDDEMDHFIESVHGVLNALFA